MEAHAGPLSVGTRAAGAPAVSEKALYDVAYAPDALMGLAR
jgi:hypothetical protein